VKSYSFRFLFLALGFLVSCKDKPKSAVGDIVVVGLTNIDRYPLSLVIENLCKHNPKVLALDIQLPDTDFGEDDARLKSALRSCKAVVLPKVIKDYTYDDRDYADTLGCDPFFLEGANTGFVNVVLDDDPFQTLSRFSTKERIKGRDEYHFAIQTAMLVDSSKTMRFLKNHSKIVPLRYHPDQNDFKLMSGYEVMELIDPDDIEGKIVLVGSISSHGVDPDIFYSPKAHRTSESAPDMWGIQYLANVVAQVLE
jgi:CHASE2 domain-containing sensor protein